MTDAFWNDRYKANEFVYGQQPNVFFQEQLEKLSSGKLLLPCEGEGRNAVYASQKGWDVEAFDYSAVAQQKALQWAKTNQVTIQYTVQSIESVSLPEDHYDTVALIFAHQHPSLRSVFHKQCANSLATGGTLILEAFEKSQLRNSSGGPKDRAMLYSVDDMLHDFQSLQIVSCIKNTITLSEGPFHQGIADVVRLLARKK